MACLLLIVISYAALLVLMMPPTNAGIIGCAAMLVLGAGLIVYKKIHLKEFWKNKHPRLTVVTVLFAASLGLTFYECWLPSSKVQTIAAFLHISTETLLFAASFGLSICATGFIYIVLQRLRTTFSNISLGKSFAGHLIFCFAVSMATVGLAQFMIGLEMLSMGWIKLVCNTLIVLVVVLLLYVLSGKVLLSAWIGASVFMLVSTINAYVYQFRGRLFEPADIFSVGTAMNVAENYSLFPIPFGVLAGWSAFGAIMLLLHSLMHKNGLKPDRKVKAAFLMGCVAASVALCFYATNLTTHHWMREGARRNGCFLDFVSKFKEITMSKPEDYSMELLNKLADQYAVDEANHGSDAIKPPHIIVIMDESFSDLRVAGDFSTNTEVLPFVSSLKENAISGYALTSVYGGNTANSEYEFLTGNSMAFLSPNVVPYQQYIREPVYSMVSYLNATCHYKSIAMHPFRSSGWNRPAAYGYLGFDECYFVEDFPQTNLVREYVSDREMFDFLIETYEEQKDTPLFLFGVTMQNHGGYSYTGENYTKSISLSEHGTEFPEVEQYLSLIHETDQAVEYLITYFQNVDENVVIVFFGDHQPKIPEAFYEMIGAAADSLDDRQKRYQVPFFIWANYEIEEQYMDAISLNYLSSYVYDVAGIDLPPYNQFLREMEEVIPSINANGFYSLADGCYLPFGEANDEESRWLGLYEALQYNTMFDQEHRNETLFPVIE